MSNCWLNVRYGVWHLKIGEKWLLSPRINKNPFHAENPKKFELHSLVLFGFILK